MNCILKEEMTSMKPAAKPIRYGKPCMAGLPSELGRQIFREILSSQPFDDHRLQTNNRRILTRLAKRMEQIEADNRQ